MDANEPLPYYAGLAKVLHGPTLALVLTYLEFHHPAPQDSSEVHPGHATGPTDEPVVLDCDIASAALGVSRRTLHIALVCLGTFWLTEDARARAARSAREFLNPLHTRFDPVKIYSFTGSKAYLTPHRNLVMRRNRSKLLSTFTQAGIISPVICQLHDSQDDDISATSLSLRTLPSILQQVMPDWGDRRKDRWERWRRDNGKKSQNPGRMAGVDKRRTKIGASSTDADASDYSI